MGRSGDFVETVEIAGSVAVVAPHAEGGEDIAFREHANHGHVGAAVLASRIVGARRLGAGIDAHRDSVTFIQISIVDGAAVSHFGVCVNGIDISGDVAVIGGDVGALDGEAGQRPRSPGGLQQGPHLTDDVPVDVLPAVGGGGVAPGHGCWGAPKESGSYRVGLNFFIASIPRGRIEMPT